MSYNRIYWAIQALGIAPEGSNGDFYGTEKAAIAEAKFVSGVQSVGITTSFDVEQVFELGQLSLYEDVEEVPDVEITIERVIDKHKLLYSRAAGVTDDTATSISAMQNTKVDVWFSLTGDANDNAGDNAPPEDQVYCSGMYMSSASFTLATDGNLTESVTMVGNHKVWHSSPTAGITGAPTGTQGGTDTVMRRNNVRIYTPSAGTTSISHDLSGGAGAISEKITSVSVSVDFGREEINVLGQKLPYYRYVSYPVEVTTEIEVLARGADNVNAKPETSNVAERAVKFFIDTKDDAAATTAGTAHADTIATIDVGSKNKLPSVTWGGGDTGGANATITYSYRNFNDLTVTSHASTYYA